MGDSAVRFTVGTTITRTDIPALCSRLADLLRGQGGGLVECDVGGVSEPDVAVVEAVARLRLTARRHGRRLVVIRAGPDLLPLFSLLGLGELLSPVPPGPGEETHPGPGPGEETRREPGHGERAHRGPGSGDRAHRGPGSGDRAHRGSGPGERANGGPGL